MSQAVAPHEETPAGLKVDAELAANFSVVIPAFNESEGIPELFQEIEATFRRHGLDGEVIFVDDGSTDDSLEVARREADRLRRFRLESHKRNLGKTEALLTGARAATTDWIVLFDADLQFSPEEIPRLLSEVATGGYDIVCGRKVGKYRKRIVSGIYNWISRRAFRVPARDLNSIKIFRADVLDAVQLRHDWHRFFVVLAHAKGYKVGEIDVTLHPRRRGAAKYSGSGRVFVGTLDLIAVWFLLLFSRKPMLLFGFTGLTLVALAVLVGMAAIVLRVLGHGFRPLLTLVVLLGAMGVSLFGFGFVAEMIATLRAEVDELKESLRALRDRQ